MNYEYSANVLKSLYKISGVEGGIILETDNGFIIDSWFSDVSLDKENLITMFAMDVISLKKSANSLELGEINQELIFFKNGWFLVITEISGTNLILVVYANSKCIVSELRYFIREHLEIGY